MEIKFICDNNLKKLSKWLRICGFDCEHKYFANHKELKEFSQKERRIIITTNKDLKDNFNTCYVPNTSVERQIIFILTFFKIKKLNPFNRCPSCNGLLFQIDKNDYQDKIPKKSFYWCKKFLKCDKCKKIYWDGTHYIRILKKINKIVI